MKEHLPLAIALMFVGSSLLLLGLKTMWRLIKANGDLERYGVNDRMAGEFVQFQGVEIPRARVPKRQQLSRGDVTIPVLLAGLVLIMIAFQGLGL